MGGAPGLLGLGGVAVGGREGGGTRARDEKKECVRASEKRRTPAPAQTVFFFFFVVPFSDTRRARAPPHPPAPPHGVVGRPPEGAWPGDEARSPGRGDPRGGRGRATHGRGRAGGSCDFPLPPNLPHSLIISLSLSVHPVPGPQRLPGQGGRQGQADRPDPVRRHVGVRGRARQRPQSPGLGRGCSQSVSRVPPPGIGDARPAGPPLCAGGAHPQAGNRQGEADG